MMNAPIHVGLLVPISNTTHEPEMLAWLPKGSTVRRLGIPRGKALLTEQTLPAYIANALDLAKQFATPKIDVVAYGCTAAGFISGPKGDARLAEQLAQVTGKPVVTTARSMVVGLQEAGLRNIALVTPYLEPVNVQLKAFLVSGGIEVRRFASFYTPDTDALGRITVEQVGELARKTMSADCDGMFVACAQLPTLGLLETLRAEFGKPVLSSIWSTTQQAIRAARLQTA